MRVAQDQQHLVALDLDGTVVHRGEIIDDEVGDAIRALGVAVSYRARSGGDTDQKIVTVVREIGSITGRVVQTMFDVQPATASRILSDLVDRGVLVKTSKATRGPTVTYGPGAKFPSTRHSRAQAPDDPAQSTLALEEPLIDD